MVYPQYLPANDMTRLGRAGKALYSTVLNGEDRMIDNLIICPIENNYRVVINTSICGKDIA